MWLALAFASAFLLGCYEVNKKISLNGNAVIPVLFLNTLISSLIFVPFIFLSFCTNVICLVKTVNGPVPDSRIEFFTTEWEPLAASDLFTPVEANWFIKEDADKNSTAFLDAVSRLDMDLIQYSLSPENLTLTATYTTPQYLGQEDRKIVTPFIKEAPKVYTWEKYHFK